MSKPQTHRPLPAQDIVVDFQTTLDHLRVYEQGIAAWALAHPPTVRAVNSSALMKPFDPDKEVMVCDDVRVIVSTCLRCFAWDWPDIAIQIREALIAEGSHWHDRYGIDAPVGIWSTAKLSYFMHPKARTFEDIPTIKRDQYQFIVARGFADNVELIREVHRDQKLIQNAIRFAKATEAKERRASP